MNTLAKKYQLKAEEYPMRFKNKRGAMGFTQDELADIAKVDRGLVVKAEAGYTTPKGIRKHPRMKIDSLTKICEILKTTQPYLEYGAFTIIDDNLIELCNVLLKLNVTERNEFIDNSITELKYR